MRNRKYFFLIAAMSMVLLLSACSDTEEEPVDSSPFVNFQGSQTEESEETAPSPAETTESQELEAPVESGNASGQGDTVVPKDEQDKITLADIEAEYGEDVSLRYPNFAELSVGVVENTNYYILFDSNGIVHHITGKRINSGFYDGMCRLNDEYMMDEAGNTLRPQFLSDGEKLIRYAKDDFGAVLWTVQKVDLLEGSKTTLTAWTSTGEMLAQFDSTQEPFTETSASALYEVLAGGDLEYQGGYAYRIKQNTQYFFLDIDTKQVHYRRDGGKYPSVQSDGTYTLSCTYSNFYYTELMDKKWNVLPGWEAMIYKGPGSPVLSEGLIYLDGHINEAHASYYPSGFYDVDLNLFIDLSQYDVQAIYGECPRFQNGYAVIQLKNSDDIPFWGVMSKDGTWAFEPRMGKVCSFVPFGDGLFINVESDGGSTGYQTFTETGESLWELWDGIQFSRSTYEFCDDFLYIQVWDGDYNHLHIIKAERNGAYTYLD